MKPFGCMYICNQTASQLLFMRRDIFQAIADPTRRAILVLVAVQAMTPNAIADRFDITRESENSSRYVMMEFIKIEPKTSYTTRNSFTDENGHAIDTGFTSSLNTNTFKAEGGKTTLHMVKQMANLSELEQFIAGGMYREGVAMGYRNLDEVLQKLVTNK